MDIVMLQDAAKYLFICKDDFSIYIYIYTYIEALTVNYSPMQIIPAQATFERSCYASDWAPRQHGSDCIGHW